MELRSPLPPVNLVACPKFLFLEHRVSLSETKLSSAHPGAEWASLHRALASVKIWAGLRGQCLLDS